jgi:hypothetical protein
MAGPTFTVSGRFEQTVDGVSEGLGGGIRFEALEVLWRGGQTGEVERDAAQQGVGVGFRGGDEATFSEACFDECIDGGMCADCGDWRDRDWLDGPPLTVFVGDTVFFAGHHLLRGAFWPDGTLGDPIPERLDFFGI